MNNKNNTNDDDNVSATGSTCEPLFAHRKKHDDKEEDVKDRTLGVYDVLLGRGKAILCVVVWSGVAWCSICRGSPSLLTMLVHDRAIADEIFGLDDAVHSYLSASF